MRLKGFEAGEFSGNDLSLSGFLRVSGTVAVCGCSRLSVPLPASDPLQLGSPLLLQSPAQIESAAPAPDSVTLGLMLLARSGLLGETSFDSLVGTSLSVSSLSKVGATLLVFASANPSALLLVRSVS